MDHNYQAKLVSAWEDAFIAIASRAYPSLKISFAAEVLFPNYFLLMELQSSFDKEVDKQSIAGIPAIAISYCVMFIYISLALGRIFPIRSIYFLVDSKFSLGIGFLLQFLFLAGLSIVAIVIGSLTASLGICSIFRIKETLEVSIVMPFLLLAIGVDNIFVLVETYDQSDPTWTVEVRIAEALSHVGSSMTLASLSGEFFHLD